MYALSYDNVPPSGESAGLLMIHGSVKAYAQSFFLFFKKGNLLMQQFTK